MSVAQLLAAKGAAPTTREKGNQVGRTDTRNTHGDARGFHDVLSDVQGAAGRRSGGPAVTSGTKGLPTAPVRRERAKDSIASPDDKPEPTRHAEHSPDGLGGAETQSIAALVSPLVDLPPMESTFTEGVVAQGELGERPSALTLELSAPSDRGASEPTINEPVAGLEESVRVLSETTEKDAVVFHDLSSRGVPGSRAHRPSTLNQSGPGREAVGMHGNESTVAHVAGRSVARGIGDPRTARRGTLPSGVRSGVGREADTSLLGSLFGGQVLAYPNGIPRHKAELGRQLRGTAEGVATGKGELAAEARQSQVLQSLNHAEHTAHSEPRHVASEEGGAAGERGVVQELRSLISNGVHDTAGLGQDENLAVTQEGAWALLSGDLPPQTRQEDAEASISTGAQDVAHEALHRDPLGFALSRLHETANRGEAEEALRQALAREARGMGSVAPSAIGPSLTVEAKREWFNTGPLPVEADEGVVATTDRLKAEEQLPMAEVGGGALVARGLRDRHTPVYLSEGGVEVKFSAVRDDNMDDPNFSRETGDSPAVSSGRSVAAIGSYQADTGDRGDAHSSSSTDTGEGAVAPANAEGVTHARADFAAALEWVAASHEALEADAPVGTRLTLPAQPEALGEAISRVALEQVDQVQILRVDLHPKELGRLQVRVAVENGVVSARIVAESGVTGQVIEAALPALREVLTSQGFTVGQLDVSVGGDGSGAFGGFDAESGGHRFTSHRQPVPAMDTYQASPVEEGEAQGIGLVNVLA